MTSRRGGAAAGVRASFVLTATVLALGACRIDGDADAHSVRSLLDAGLTVAAEPPAPGRPLDVATAFRLANARSEALAETGEEYVRAVVDRRRAAAAFLPTATLVPSAFLKENTSSPDSNHGGALNASGTLEFATVTDVYGERRAEVAAIRQRALLFAAQDDLLADTARVMLVVVLAERRTEVLRASLAVQEARVEDSRGRVDAGVVRPLDVALAETRAADARVRIVQSEKDARNARSALAYLVAWDVGTHAVDDTLPLPADPPPVEELLARAEERRPEIVAAEAAIEEARAQVEMAYGEWWPSVSVDLDVLLASGPDAPELDWASILRISVPLFRAGLVEADIREALSRLREATLARSRVHRLIRREIEIAREAYVSERRRLDALAIRLDAAGRARTQAEGLWEAGLGSNLERLVAQDELLSVQLEIVLAEQDRKSRNVDLLRAAGTLHEIAGLVRPDPRRDPAEEPRAEAR